VEPIAEALELLKRHAVLEAGLRQAGGIRVTEERELYALRERLQRYPQPSQPFFKLQATSIALSIRCGLKTLGADNGSGDAPGERREPLWQVLTRIFPAGQLGRQHDTRMRPDRTLSAVIAQ